VNQDKKLLDEIQSLLPIDNNDDLEILKNNHSICEITERTQKSVNDILSEDLQIQENVNRLSKPLLIIGTSNIIIASLLAMGHIFLSPAILISGLIIYYQVNKILTKFKEWELEIGNAIDKINSEKHLMQERRREISELIQQLNDLQKLLNHIEFKYKAAKIAGKLVSFVDIIFDTVKDFNMDIHNLNIIIRSINIIVKSLVSTTFNTDDIVNKFHENITKQYSNIFTLQLDTVAEVKFERPLLDKSFLELGLNFDFLLILYSKIRQLPQFLETGNMLLVKFLKTSK
jgi:hypothetical protein